MAPLLGDTVDEFVVWDVTLTLLEAKVIELVGGFVDSGNQKCLCTWLCSCHCLFPLQI